MEKASTLVLNGLQHSNRKITTEMCFYIFLLKLMKLVAWYRLCVLITPNDFKHALFNAYKTDTL